MWVFLLLSTQSAALQCSVYTCEAALEPGECLQQVNNSAYSVQPCPSKSICDLTSPIGHCVPGLEDIRLPGEICESDGQCSSSKCHDYRCEGQHLNETCAELYDCEGGLYCDTTSSVCRKHIEKGGVCESDYECDNHSLCSITSLLNSTRMCVPYFSIPTGSPISNVTNPISGVNYGCYSMFAVLENDHYICHTPTSSVGYLPVPCTNDTTCMDVSGQYQGKCQCSSDGNSYCSLFPLDEPVQTVGRLMLKFLYQNDKCNTYSRFSFFCLINDLTYVSDVYELIKHKQLIETDLYTQTALASDCAVSVLYPDYYAFLVADKRQKASPCLNYTCDLELKETACAWQTNEIVDYGLWQTVHFAECANGTVCTNGQCNASLPSPAYPGDPCQLDSDCMYGVCQTDVCVYASEGQPCESIFSCNRGLYCAPTGKCALQGYASDACESDYACVNTMVCNEGACTAYYSLPIGARSYTSEACQSGYIETNMTDYISYCTEPPVSKDQQYVAQCSKAVSCPSQDGRELVKCTCGATDQGECFCPLYPGDPPFQLAIASYQLLISLNNGTSCNTASRHTLKCYADLQDLQPYYYYKLNMTYYQLAPVIQNTTECVLKNNPATAGYFQLMEEFQAYINSAISYEFS